MAIKYMSGILEGKSTIGWVDKFNQPTCGISATVRIAAKAERKPGQRMDRTQQAKTLNFIVAKGSPCYNEFKAMSQGAKFEAAMNRAVVNENGQVNITFDEVNLLRDEDFYFEAPELDFEPSKQRQFFDSAILE